MKIDLEEARTSAYQTDVCICGGGIAGLTLASALMSSGLSVALLEGGGMTTEERSQSLFEVEMAGHPHEGATKGRFRLFGGSSTQWGGQLLPFADDIFEPPSGTGMSAWSVRSSEIEAHYAEVLHLMNVPPEPFGAVALTSEKTAPPPPDADIRVRFSRWAPFRQRNMAVTAGKSCSECPTVTVYLHANVTRLEIGGPSTDRISRVHVMNFSGKTFTFSARFVIICLGVIETTRLLLVSGIANQHDQVGRYFHDHLGIHAATLHGPARSAAIRLFAPEIRDGAFYTPKLEATYRWREQHASQAVMAHFPIVEPEDSTAATLKLLFQAFQRRKLPPGLLPRLAALPFGSAELLRMAYATKVKRRRALSQRAEFRLNIDVEQQPSPSSRITLSSVKDQLGVLRARLDWKITDREERSVRLFARKVQAELQAIGVAPIEIDPNVLNDAGDWLACSSDTYHMMGGTRMGTCAENSVVDSDLKVHGIQNAYIASCSVFPTGGSSNPTFTMMALTLRLAERLKMLAASAVV